MSRKVYITSDMGLDTELWNAASEDASLAMMWPWLLTTLDDWGRVEADAHTLKARMFPEWPRDKIDDQVVENALALFAKHKLIRLYYVDERRYLCVKREVWFRIQTHIRWDKKGSASSRIPEPPANEAEDEYSRNFPELPVRSRPFPSLPGDSLPSPSPSPSYTPPVSPPRGKGKGRPPSHSRNRKEPEERHSQLATARDIPNWKIRTDDSEFLRRMEQDYSLALLRRILREADTWQRGRAGGQRKRDARRMVAAWLAREAQVAPADRTEELLAATQIRVPE